MRKLSVPAQWRETGRGLQTDKTSHGSPRVKMCSPSHFCSPLRGHPPHPCQFFAGEHKFVQETRAEEVRLCQFYRPSITPSRTPTSLVLPAIPRTPLSSKNSTRTLLFGSPSDSARNLDILCGLPPEVATQVLSYLHPRDLCQVCLVSCNWYNLAQHRGLRKRRQLYVQARREEYRQSKENFSPYVQTPRRPQMTPASTPLAPVQLRTTQRRSVPNSPSTVRPPSLTWSRRGSLFESPTVPLHSQQPSSSHRYSLQDSPWDVETLDQYSNGNELPLALSKHRLNDQQDSPMEPVQRLWRGGSITDSLSAQGLHGHQWSYQKSPSEPTFQSCDSVNRLPSFHTMQSPRESTDGLVNSVPPLVHSSLAESLGEAEMNTGQQWSHQSGSRADSPIKSGLLWSSSHNNVFASDSPVTLPPNCQHKSVAESPIFPFQLYRKRLISSPEARQRSSTPPITIQHSVLHRQNSMPTIPSSACLEHTPDPLHLVEEVKGLSINEKNEKEVRRQLFPNSMMSTADSLGKSPSSILCLHQPETLVGRKANRSRLRRL